MVLVAKRNSREEKHTFLILKVDDFEVSSEASINLSFCHAPSPFTRSDDLAFEFATTLTIHATCIRPSRREDERHRFTVSGSEIHAGDHSLTLEDFQARDENGVFQYRSYRGEQIPVYVAPQGIGRLQRERGTKNWEGWFWFHPRLVSDMLNLLIHIKPLYLTLHERKVGRNQWVQSLSLQTTKPDEE